MVLTTVFDPSLYDESVAVEKPKSVVRPKAVRRPKRVEKLVVSPAPVVDDVEVPEVRGVIFDPRLFDKVLGQPEGMNHKEYRNVLARYVSTLSEVERVDVLSCREEIGAAEVEWKELNHGVLRRLGFSEAEAGMLCDKRLDSPGMRFLIRKRAEEVKKGLQARDVLRRVG